MQRKRTTVQDYRIMLRHLGPFFGKRPLDAIEPGDIGDYIASKRRAGLAMKTVTNHLQFAHAVFAFSLRRGWVLTYPVATADRPPAEPADPDTAYGRASWLRFGGATSTGPRASFVCDAATRVASGRLPRADGRFAPCRRRTASRARRDPRGAARTPGSRRQLRADQRRRIQAEHAGFRR